MRDNREYMKVINNLNDVEAKVIETYVEDLNFYMNQIKDAYEDRLKDITYLESEIETVVDIFNNLLKLNGFEDDGMKSSIFDFLKGQELIN